VERSEERVWVNWRVNHCYDYAIPNTNRAPLDLATPVGFTSSIVSNWRDVSDASLVICGAGSALSTRL